MISVIIPTCHRNDMLAKCLDCLVPGMQVGMKPAASDGKPAQGASHSEYEVIVTDDGSHTTAQRMIAEHYPWVRWIPGPQRGPAANRNNGARQASGEWFAFVDDDCLPDAEWLRVLHDTTTVESLDIVEGKTICPGKQDNPFQEHVENPGGNNYWSCNLAVRRETFELMNGFHEGFLEAGGEDMEFAWRINRDRLRTRFAPAFLVRHPPRLMTWHKIWHRVYMIRWTRLYRLVTKQALPLDAHPLWVSLDLISSQTVDLLRTTSHLATKFDLTSWRRQLFFQLLKWATFPLVLPHLLVWEFRFRSQLKKSGGL